MFPFVNLIDNLFCKKKKSIYCLTFSFSSEVWFRSLFSKIILFKKTKTLNTIGPRLHQNVKSQNKFKNNPKQILTDSDNNIKFGQIHCN